MDRSDLASKVFQCSQTSWEFWRDREITPFRQGPFNPPPKTTTCHSRRRRSGCPTFFNHQQHIPQAWKESEKKIPFPSPRTQETAATRSRSTSSRLAFRNATPEHVLARHRRCYGASTVTDHESPASGAVGYASSSGVDSSLTRKGRKVCRINEPVPPGHSCRLKQKKEKAPFVDVVSSPKCSYLSETSPRAPSSPCSDRPLRSLASKKSEVQDRADFQAHEGRKKRRRRASAASEAARKRKMSRSQFRIPQEMQARPKRKPAKRRPRGHVCCLV